MERNTKMKRKKNNLRFVVVPSFVSNNCKLFILYRFIFLFNLYSLFYLFCILTLTVYFSSFFMAIFFRLIFFSYSLLFSFYVFFCFFFSLKMYSLLLVVTSRSIFYVSDSLIWIVNSHKSYCLFWKHFINRYKE